jgi:hypothetical protein
MCNKSILKNILFTLVLLQWSVAPADTLAIPGHYEADRSMALPSRGSSMDRVLSEFGEPIQRKGPVGDPPISEWLYGDFRVYFEYQTVLHSVDLTTIIMPK